jgi:hypothetical protein
VADNKVKVFYVTYKVINYQSITDNHANINADSTSGGGDIQVDETKTHYYLEMFYYNTTYTTTSETYTFLYTEGDVKLKSSEGTFTYDSSKDSDYERYFVDGDENIKYIYDIQNQKLFDASADKVEIGGGTWETQTLNPSSTPSKTVFNSGFSNIFEFANFIKLYELENSISLTEPDGSARTFTLVEIEKEGRYGINLNGVIKFQNELCAELALVAAGVKTYSIAPYSQANLSGFRLYAKNSITPKSSKTLSSMFLPSYFTTAGCTSSNISLSSSIIAVGSDRSNDWVSGGTLVSPQDGSIYAKINIPNGDGTNTSYYIKKVTYSNTSSSSAIYSVVATYYYIVADADKVVVPNYYAVGTESTFFKLQYRPNGGNVEFDAKKAVTVWYQDSTSGQLVFKPTEKVDISNIEQSSKTPDTVDLTESGSKLSIASSTLIEYKLKNPTEKNYPEYWIKITAEGKTVYCKLVFMLPTNPIFEIEQASASSVTLVEGLTKVEEKGVQRYVDASKGYNSTTGSLALNKSAIDNYFTENPTMSKLEFRCLAYIDDESDIYRRRSFLMKDVFSKFMPIIYKKRRLKK